MWKRFLMLFAVGCSAETGTPPRQCHALVHVHVTADDGPIVGAVVAFPRHDYDGWGQTDAKGSTTISSRSCAPTEALLVTGSGIATTSGTASLLDGGEIDVPITVTRVPDDAPPFILDCATNASAGSIRVLLSKPIDPRSSFATTVQTTCRSATSGVVATLDAVKPDVAIAFGTFDSETCTTDASGTRCTRCVATSATVVFTGLRDLSGHEAKPSLSAFCTL
jgi:hypothetical protein